MGQGRSFLGDSGTPAHDDDAQDSASNSFSSVEAMGTLELLTQVSLVHHTNVQAAVTHERLFRNCASIVPSTEDIPRTLIGKYRHTGEWFFCRIRSHDCDDTFTIVWEDGSLQIGTLTSELMRPSLALSKTIEKMLKDSVNTDRAASMPPSSTGSVKSKSAAVDIPTYNGFTVWEAAKKGDMEAVLGLIDRGDATPNDVEILETTATAAEEGQEQQQGRSPLYWACFGGHAELVRELLARGGFDSDGAAYLAVTSREKADDDRDLMFDPDTETYSDWVDYPTKATQLGDDTIGETATAKNDDLNDTALIRAMLAAASATPAKRRGDANAMRQRLPQRLYDSTAGGTETVQESKTGGECIVCLDGSKAVANSQSSSPSSLAIAVPCGHICACYSCLELIRKRGDGCPICRAAISTVVPRRA